MPAHSLFPNAREQKTEGPTAIGDRAFSVSVCLARMERSAIRGLQCGGTVPDFACAPSGPQVTRLRRRRSLPCSLLLRSGGLVLADLRQALLHFGGEDVLRRALLAH